LAIINRCWTADRLSTRGLSHPEHCSITFEPWKRIWKSWAPNKCKDFLWLAIRNRYWTAED
jgi:hypothetical protein